MLILIFNSTAYCHAHSFIFIFYILFFISYFLFILFYAYFPCVVFYNICTVHGADPTHISLLVIQSLYSRVCDKYNLKLEETFLINVENRCAASEITWPSGLDARVVFRSAEFAKYFVILSVSFKTFCIGLIMNTSTVKGDRKREIGQSPIKKKFRDATISREDIDEAVASGIKLAFGEQQSTLDSVVTSAVRAAVDSVLIPALRKLSEDIQATNNSVKELREEFEAMAAAAKQTRDRVDSVQATTREDRSAITDLRNQLERLTEKMTDMEDKSRRNNIRLVGLPEGMEGSDVAGFLRINLSKWIPVTEWDICCGSTGQREGGGCSFFDPTGGAWWPVWRRWWRERYGWSLVQFLIFSAFLSPHGIVFFYFFIRYNRPFAD